MSTNRFLLIALWCLQRISVCGAEEGPVGAHEPIICQQEQRCFAIASSALEISKTDKKEALRQMLLAYAEFPDPRLCFNIGRLYQQVGENQFAIVHYRKFLDSRAEQDPKQLAKAQGFLEQAEAESKSPPIAAPLPKPGMLLSKEKAPTDAAIQVNPSTDKPQYTRLNFRIKLGLAFLGGGVLASVTGATLLSQSTACSYAASSSGSCVQVARTNQVGTAFLSIGVLFTLGGMITAAIPNRQNAPVVGDSWSSSTRTLKATN